jgi:hypothetical protein
MLLLESAKRGGAMQRSCLACGCRITYPLYHPAPQPLAALHLPRTAEAARSVLRFPMDWQVCAACGHVFNVEFDYYQVPYEDNSNLMYNRGPLWLEHMAELVDLLVAAYGAASKTLVDIGCGDGLFFKLLLQRAPDCRCIGFEPGIEAENARRNGSFVYQDYFHPQRDLKRIAPDFLICRHVIEHLANPRDFVGGIAYWCNRYDRYPVLLAEVPRIDKAVAQGRLTDFLYEHVSNFTAASLRVMLETTGFDILDFRSCYGDEVAVAIARPRRLAAIHAVHESTAAFREAIQRQRLRVRRQLDELRAAGRSVAFWGGTGKGAAFLNAFEITADEFPLVIDSDPQKVGRYVPGTAQEIRAPECLLEQTVDVLILTTRWRAKDIVGEVRRRGIRVGEVWVLEQGELRPYDPASDEVGRRETPMPPEALPLPIRVDSAHAPVPPPLDLPRDPAGIVPGPLAPA